MTDFILPGRCRRSYRCRRCNKEVNFRMHLDLASNQIVASGECEEGHVFSESWMNGSSPSTFPVVSSLEFTPIPRKP